MGSAVLFILRSRLLVYSARSGVDKVQVALSGFSVRFAFLISSATVMFRTITVECCTLYPCCVGVFCMFSVM